MNHRVIVVLRMAVVLPSLLVVSLALAVMLSATATAQLGSPDQWVWMESIPKTNFPSETLSPTGLFFTDATTGYYSADSLVFKTTDGGDTWSRLQTPIPLPHTMVTASFGYSRTGMITEDGGETWQAVQPDVFVPDDHDRIYDFIAVDRNRMYCLYFEQRDFGGTFGQDGPIRLAFTLDGTTWRRADSMVTIGTQKRLLDTTLFGVFRAPDTAVANQCQWTRLIGATSDGAVWAVAEYHRDRVDNVPYFGRLGTVGSQTVWHSPPPIDLFPLGVTVGLHESTMLRMWLAAGVSATSNTSVLMTSSDDGLTWSYDSVPGWASMQQLRFFDDQTAISSNARTTDGGATWQRWNHPYRNPGTAQVGYVSAPTSDRLYVANQFSLFARSTDGGASWTSNDAGGQPLAIAAWNDRVVVGRTYNSILVSADTGETWNRATLPPHAAVVRSIAFADTLAGDHRMYAVAEMAPLVGDPYVAILESTDRGLAWSETAPVSDLDPLIGGGQLDAMQLQFAPGSSGDTAFISGRFGVLGSVDGARTWTWRSDSTISRLGVIDGHRLVATSVSNAGIAIRVIKSTDGGTSWNQIYLKNAPGKPLASGFHMFSPEHYVLIYPNNQQLFREWDLMQTRDGGANWQVRVTQRTEGPVGSNVLFVDSSLAYSIGDYGVIMRSTDGGYTFRMRHDTAGTTGSGIAQSISATDGRYIYLMGRNNEAARWRIATEPTTGVNEAYSGGMGSDGRLVLFPNIVDAATSEITIRINTADRGSQGQLRIIDVLGVERAVVQLRSDGNHHVATLQTAELPAGRYFVVLQQGGGLRIGSLMVR